MYQGREVYAILLAAGSGSRMPGECKKQYRLLGGRPLFLYSLRRFLDCAKVDGICLMLPEEDLADARGMVSDLSCAKPLYLLAGGKERYDSVYRALQALRQGLPMREGLESAVPNDGFSKGDMPMAASGEVHGGCLPSAPLVLIHDSARPFLSGRLLEAVLSGAAEHRACIPGVPVKDTIKILEEGFVRETPDRQSLWSIQTPQGFDFSLIYASYMAMMRDLQERQEHEESASSLPYGAFSCPAPSDAPLPPAAPPVTDDAMAVERYGHARVKVCMGDYLNFKVTTEEDLLLAEALLPRYDTGS